MKRSTKTAPVSLSTSYLIGSPRIGISMITLQSFGMSRPAGTRSRFMRGRRDGRRAIIAGGSPRYHGEAFPPKPFALPMRTCVVVLVAAAAIAAPAARGQARIEAAPLVTPFSAGKPGAALPAPWEPFRIAPGKKPTQYDLVADQGTIVLHARADAAASALRHDTRFDLRAAPIIGFRWKISRLIDDQDNAIATREDSPVRVIIEFQGDRSRLSFRDRTS